MDLSKLPRLSGSESTASEAHPVEPHSANVVPATPPAPSINQYAVGAELWISFVVGLLLIGMSWHFPAYLFDRLAGRPYHTGIIFTSDGSEVPYPQVEGFAMLSDAAVFSFAAALLLDPLLRLICIRLGPTATQLILRFGFGLTSAAVLFNLCVAVKLLNAGIMPIISGLAVAFGGYIALDQWRLVRSLK